MHVYPKHPTSDLTQGLHDSLLEFRALRNFDADSYIEAKAGLLNDYMRKSGLKACVIAVSGGLDSAAVLAIAKHASLQSNSPIEKIIPVCLPVRTEGATSNQETATNKGEEVSRAMGITPFTIDLSESHQAIKAAVDSALGVDGNLWASGQLAATTRTPAYYYVTSLLSDMGYPAIVVGTTNRDEGAYLGYVGKASDAVVDVQLITDLFKSEVYRVAAKLVVPQSVLAAVPTGDMFDGRTDADVFGASYDAAELYQSMLCASEAKRAEMMQSWSLEDRERYAALSENLENLHRYNAHKYIAGWPGVHLNILPTAVPGGWQYGPHDPVITISDGPKNLSGMFDVPESFLTRIASNQKAETIKHLIPDVPDGINHQSPAFTLDNLLLSDEVTEFRNILDQQAWFPVGIDGIKANYHDGDKIGSWRLYTYDPELANMLWLRIQHYITPLLYTPENASQDTQDAVVWRAVGINPLFRFIKYTPDGLLVTHYDAPANPTNDQRTLETVVMYLTDSAPTDGGLTRFVHDTQETMDPMQRDFTDWDRCANDDEVIAAVVPKAGSALLFAHRTLHDSSPFTSDKAPEKIIVRTDINRQRILTPCVG